MFCIIRIILLVMLFTTFASAGCYAGITGMVIDAETQQPIEGAIVLVEWTKTKGLPGMTHTESAKVTESVTDKAGKVTINSYLDPMANSPSITIYRKGYVAWNNEYIYPGYKKRTDFKWENGCVFRMENYKPEYSYTEHTSFIHSVTKSSIGKKELIENAYRWEELKAFEERKKSWIK